MVKDRIKEPCCSGEIRKPCIKAYCLTGLYRQIALTVSRRSGGEPNGKRSNRARSCPPEFHRARPNMLKVVNVNLSILTRIKSHIKTSIVVRPAIPLINFGSTVHTDADAVIGAAGKTIGSGIKGEVTPPPRRVVIFSGESVDRRLAWVWPIKRKYCGGLGNRAAQHNWPGRGVTGRGN